MELYAIGGNAMAALSWPRIAVGALAIAAGLAALGSLRQRDNIVLLSTPVQIRELPASPAASMRSLPSEVQLVLVSLCNGCAFADSDSPWNATDVVDARSPRRRLTRTEKWVGDGSSSMSTAVSPPSITR
jgi:hypothetical protein